MSDVLVWSKRDTHCVWCGKPVAGADEEERHDKEWFERDDDCDIGSCWCSSWCWQDFDYCDYRHSADVTLADLRALVEAQAAVIARFMDGWRPAVHPQMDWHGYWWGGPRGYQPMTPDEQQVIYGRVVTEETEQ